MLPNAALERGDSGGGSGGRGGGGGDRDTIHTLTVTQVDRPL